MEHTNGISPEMREELRRRGWLSPAGLAEYLGIPIATVYRWNYTGAGPRFVRIGKHVRYEPDAVADWLEQHAGPVAA